MASRTLVRGLHTTRCVLDNAGAGAAKTSLGFKAQPERTRALPTIKIKTNTAQRSVPGAGPPSDRQRGDRRGDQPRGDRRANQPSGDQPRADRPRGDQPRGDRPRGDRPSGDRPRADRPRGDAPRGDRAPQQRTAGLNAVSSEFFEGAELAAPARKFTRPDAPRRDTPRKPRESKGRGKPKLGDGSRPGEGTRAARTSSYADRPPRSRSAPMQEMRLEPVKRDTSAVSLFGTSPLIVSPLARSRDPRASVWAKGMERADGESAELR